MYGMIMNFATFFAGPRAIEIRSGGRGRKVCEL